MNRRNWRESPSSVSHGDIVERIILTKQDDSKPGREGAFLLNMESFARGYLEGRVSTVPESHERVQEVIYVVRGRGEFDGGGVKRDVGEGDAIMVPAGVEHVLKNLAEEHNPYGVTEIDAKGGMMADPNIATVKKGGTVELQRISEVLGE